MCQSLAVHGGVDGYRIIDGSPLCYQDQCLGYEWYRVLDCNLMQAKQEQPNYVKVGVSESDSVLNKIGRWLAHSCLRVLGGGTNMIALFDTFRNHDCMNGHPVMMHDLP